jgi:hypothetical protein
MIMDWGDRADNQKSYYGTPQKSTLSSYDTYNVMYMHKI